MQHGKLTRIVRNISYQGAIGGAYLTITNLLFSVLITVLLISLGETTSEIDGLDVLFEFSSVVLAFVMFAIIGCTRISIVIKAPFLLGLLLMQLGRTIDGLDEFIVLAIPHWSALGDGLALAGEALVVYAGTRWILHTYKLSAVDKLTQLYNRHYLDKAFEKARMFRRHNDSDNIHLIMLDIDDFKRINDCYGHATGDDVLKRVAAALCENTRATDIVARQGGEEFEILLSEGDLQTATSIAERIRVAIANKSDPTLPSCTASLGVAQYHLGDDIKSLRRRADYAVYKAKSEGKNKVVLAENCTESSNILEKILRKEQSLEST